MNDDSSIARLAGILRDEAARLRPGERLTPSRELVRLHGVSPVTVSHALARLAAEGCIVTRPGSGAFAAPPKKILDSGDHSWQTVALGDRVVEDSAVTNLLALPGEGVIPMTGGYLNAALRPDKELSAAMVRAVRRPGAWAMPPLGGVPELRRWFAKEAGAHQDDVLVVSGGQAALTHAFRALAAPGEPILVETPTYPGALAAAKAAGLRATAVPIDDDGVRPELLAEAFAMTGARVFYCQPTLHNPTGATLTRERREQVLAIARAAGAFVIEDDFARYLATSPPPPPMITMDGHGTVVHVLSLSKITAPSLRVAGLIARGPAARRLRASQLVESFFVARPLQEAAAEFVTSPAWRRHVAMVHREIGERQALLLAGIARYLPEARVELTPRGGYHVWVRLRADEQAFGEAAMRAGVLVSPGRVFFAAEPPGPYVRLTHIAATAQTEISEAMRRLGAAFGVDQRLLR